LVTAFSRLAGYASTFARSVMPSPRRTSPLEGGLLVEGQEKRAVVVHAVVEFGDHVADVFEGRDL